MSRGYQWRIHGRGLGDPGPSPLFLDQTEARRAENKFLETGPPLSKGLDDRPAPYFVVCIRHWISLFVGQFCAEVLA